MPRIADCAPRTVDPKTRMARTASQEVILTSEIGIRTREYVISRAHIGVLKRRHDALKRRWARTEAL